MVRSVPCHDTYCIISPSPNVDPVQETIRFRPEIVAWWPRLMGAGARLGRVHRWEVAGRGPDDGVQGLAQHGTDTLVLCLGGAARIEDGHVRLDLGSGDAVVVRPGAWHRHARLRRGALVYQQGVIAGRSDFFLADEGLRVDASWPEQPAWSLLAAVGAAEAEDERRTRLAALLAHLAGETAEPLPVLHPAVLAMEYAIWENLHRPDVVARTLAAAGVSRVQAYRLASRRWGLGIATVVRRARLDLARSLIEGGMAVGEAARRSGIPERSVLARAYRRRWGEPPSRLRHAEARSS
jgi:AraC-like DNA-binding protein